MYVYQCEDSLEGIFTGIYQIYEDKRPIQETTISLVDELFLFAQYIPVIPDVEKTKKVVRTLIKRFGNDDYQTICFALSSPSPLKAQAVYRTIALGLKATGYIKGHLFDNLADDFVNEAFSLARAAGRENHLLLGFVRFEELENGMLSSVISPKNNLLTFLMPHFADRLPMDNFVIYDEGRNLYGIHPAGKQWFLWTQEEDGGASEMELSSQELYFQELFRCFVSSIAIRDRRNLKLQRNLLPLRFREFMTEFN